MTAAAHRDDWPVRCCVPCADPDLFFPVSSSGPFLDQMAKAICASCQARRAHDPYRGQLTGGLPQALSHPALADTVLPLTRQHGHGPATHPRIQDG